MLRRLALCAFLCAAALPAWAAADYAVPFPAHHVIGNVYFVGTRDQANYLITTPAGNILINSGPKESLPEIKKSIAALGFQYADTKILLISHAHFDHDGAAATVLKETHAKYDVMDADVPVVESGGKTDFAYGDQGGVNIYPAVKVDRTLHDGDKVSLGGTTLTAHKTPGHTKGCTTWTLPVTENGKTLNVVIVGSLNVNPGFVLVNNAKYPQIAKDYAHTFQEMAALKADVFLGAHGSYYGLEAKYPKLKPGAANPFIDPAGYQAYVAERRQTFEKELARQKAGGGPAPTP